MEARKFRGRTSREALKLVREALGEDATIIATRSVPGRAPQDRGQIEITASNGGQNALSSQRIDSLIQGLLAQGLSKEAITEISLRYQESRTAPSKEFDREAFITALAPILIFGAARTPLRRVVAVIGSTGVGKTTTVAKLAARDRALGKSVGLITIDTHRVGGVEQLGRYATLLGLPICAVSQPEELAVALNELQGADRIYVDTAGSSPRDTERLSELRTALSVSKSIEPMLLLPASGNAKDLNSVVEAFEDLNPITAGITKLDETQYFGPCLSTIIKNRLPLRLLTAGQRVPEDLEVASASKIADLLFPISH